MKKRIYFEDVVEGSVYRSKVGLPTLRITSTPTVAPGYALFHASETVSMPLWPSSGVDPGLSPALRPLGLGSAVSRCGGRKRGPAAPGYPRMSSTGNRMSGKASGVRICPRPNERTFP